MVSCKNYKQYIRSVVLTPTLNVPHVITLIKMVTYCGEAVNFGYWQTFIKIN